MKPHANDKPSTRFAKQLLGLLGKVRALGWTEVLRREYLGLCPLAWFTSPNLLVEWRGVDPSGPSGYLGLDPSAIFEAVGANEEEPMGGCEAPRVGNLDCDESMRLAMFSRNNRDGHSLEDWFFVSTAMRRINTQYRYFGTLAGNGAAEGMVLVIPTLRKVKAGSAGARLVLMGELANFDLTSREGIARLTEKVFSQLEDAGEYTRLMVALGADPVEVALSVLGADAFGWAFSGTQHALKRVADATLLTMLRQVEIPVVLESLSLTGCFASQGDLLCSVAPAIKKAGLDTTAFLHAGLAIVR